MSDLVGLHTWQILVQKSAKKIIIDSAMVYTNFMYYSHATITKSEEKMRKSTESRIETTKAKAIMFVILTIVWPRHQTSNWIAHSCECDAPYF